MKKKKSESKFLQFTRVFGKLSALEQKFLSVLSEKLDLARNEDEFIIDAEDFSKFEEVLEEGDLLTQLHACATGLLHKTLNIQDGHARITIAWISLVITLPDENKILLYLTPQIKPFYLRLKQCDVP